VVVCVVGGIEPARVLTVASEQLAAVKLRATAAPRAKLHLGNREMTWDFDARHLVLAWPIPKCEAKDFPPLLIAAQRLNMQFFSDAELKKQTGMVFAGADLRTPEGNFFYVSASLRQGSSFKEIHEKISGFVRQLAASGQDLSWVPMFAQQQAQMLTSLPNPALLRSQLPPSMTESMLEMNAGLQWGMNEFRYGSSKSLLVKGLAELKGESFGQVVKKYLLDTPCSATTLQPQP
jgi:predicted Zn-dependent peptidase